MLNISISKYFPDEIAAVLNEYFTEDEAKKNKEIEEIRIRADKPIILKFNKSEKILKRIVSQTEILKIMQYICDNSIYAYQNEICSGYITVRGGHRIGVSGNCVIENGRVINISYISSINFRIAKQVLDCSNKILKFVVDTDNNNVYNTLIVSPPGEGKTTILRDLIRKISNGIEDLKFRGINVGLVDERGEIAALYKGVPQNSIGVRTDVLDNVPKDIGMNMLIRSMTPKVICADEIGKKEDIDAINYAVCSGVKGIFTAHGNSIENLSLNPAIRNLLNTHLIERIIFLSNRSVSKVFALDKKNLEYIIME